MELNHLRSVRSVFRAIGALSSDPKREPELRPQIDQILSDAVEFGILLRPSSINPSNPEEVSSMNDPKMMRLGTLPSSTNVYDLSCLTFPVARAACRYVLMKRILPLQLQIENNHDTRNETAIGPTTIPDVMFVTGSGLQHRLITTVHNGNISSSSSSSSSSSPTPTIGIPQPRSMFMREYVQYILLNDFDVASFTTSHRLTLSSSTATHSGSTSNNNVVTVKAETLKEWCVLSR